MFDINQLIVKYPELQKGLFYLRKFYESLLLTFGVDKRSLAFFRIMLGLTICGDILDRARDTRAHYSDYGIIDRDTYFKHFSSGYVFNVYLMAGTEWTIYLVMAVHFFISMLMTIGFWTKTTTFFNWIFTTSLIHRNIIVFHGGDMYLRCLLFLSFWLPCEGFYSWDQTFYYSDSIKKRQKEETKWQQTQTQRAFYGLMYSPSSASSSPPASSSFISGSSKRDDDHPSDNDHQEIIQTRIESIKQSPLHASSRLQRVLGWSWNEMNRIYAASQDRHYMILCFGSVAIIFQVFALYYYSYFFKTGDPWRKDYTATFYALQLDYFRLPLGDFLLQFPEVCKILTRSVLFWEWFGPLLLVFPFPPNIHGPIRLFVSFSLFMLHLGFAMALRLGTFFWISETGVIFTLPPIFWDYFIFYGFKNFIIWLNADKKEIQKSQKGNFPLFFTIYFNGNCKVCETWSRILSDFLLFSETRVLPHPQSLPSSPDAKEIKIEDTNWVVVDGNGVRYTGYEAFLKIIQFCPFTYLLYHPLNHSLPRLLFTSSPQPLRLSLLPSSSSHKSGKTKDAGMDEIDQDQDQKDSLNLSTENEVIHSEDWISKQLHPVHDLDSLVESSARQQGGFSASLFVTKKRGIQNRNIRKLMKMKNVIYLCYAIIALNIIPFFFTLHILNANQAFGRSTTAVFPPSVPYGPWSFWGRFFFLDQYWAMFAPKPPDSHWYYVIVAEKVNKQEVELWKNRGMFTWEGSPVSWDKPNPFPPSIRNHRWFKLYENGLNSQARNRILLPNFGRWVCTEWNIRHTKYEEKIWTFKIHVLWERQNPDGSRQPPTQHLLWHHICFNP